MQGQAAAGFMVLGEMLVILELQHHRISMQVLEEAGLMVMAVTHQYLQRLVL
jgi:hypothetical protein